jgi:tRNA1(Val) A37 N6-methylase TrmN6
MNDYFQPAFYKFNQDSTRLIDFVLERNKSAADILDMGSGSGIIGIELANVLKPKSLHLLEGQNVWREYLEKNTELFLKKEIEVEIIMETFGNWKPRKKFDLIVCNPPYFLPGHGEPSSNPLRNNSRSFMIDDWRVLMSKINLSLHESGKAYFVIKDDPRILKEIESNLDKLDIVKLTKDGLQFLELFRLNENRDQHCF